MKNLRATIKIVGTVGYTLFCYSIYFIIYLPMRWFGSPTEPWKNNLLRFWSAGIIRILNLKVSVYGTPPEPPFFVVSNHVSYLDIVLLYNQLKGTFVAKKEVRSWPFLGYMAYTLGVIFIDRNRKRDVTRVNKLQSESLGNHQGIILFPEGKTSDGTQLLPLRSPLLEFPAKSGVPIHYVTLYYETNKDDIPAGDSICWHSDTPLHKHMFEMAKCKEVRCTITFGKKPVQNQDRKQLAETLEMLMKDQFIPILS